MEYPTDEQKKVRILELQAYIDEPALPAEQRAEYFYEQGYLWAMMKNYEAATASFNKTTQIKPNYESAWYNLGIALSDLGKLDEAVAAYRKQLDVKPDHECGFNNLGNTYFKQNKLFMAEQNYAKALEINAKDIDVLSNDAELALIQQDNKRCLQRIEQALALVTNKDQNIVFCLF